MLLSNSAKSFLICGFVLLVLVGCRWWQESGSVNNSDTPAPSRIPFSTAEPETFQCEVVRSDGENEEKTFYAHNGGNWRLDLNANETILRTDKYYRLHNEKKMYAEVPIGDPSAIQPEFVADLTVSALNQNKNAKFEPMGSDGSLTRYRVTLDDPGGASAVIYVDEKNGLVTREEFFSPGGQTDPSAKPAFIFELRDLKLNVDDSIFAIPAGYKKLEWKDYLTAARSRK